MAAMTMIETVGDLFAPPRSVQAIVIPTNREVRSDGTAVVGAGLARQAVGLWPKIALRLGARLQQEPDCLAACVAIPRSRVDGAAVAEYGAQLPDGRPVYVVAFPTKHSWRDDADLALIERSAASLAALFDPARWGNRTASVALPRVGCGLGRLDWETAVRPVLARHLGEQFIVLTQAAQ